MDDYRIEKCGRITMNNDNNSPIDMQNSIHIFNLKFPTNFHDAANKFYVDRQISSTLNFIQGFLKLDESIAMTGDLDMAYNNIIHLKEPEDHQATYAANVKFVANAISDNNTIFETLINTKTEESEERSIIVAQQENVFEKVMKDDIFKEDDDDLHKVAQ